MEGIESPQVFVRNRIKNAVENLDQISVIANGISFRPPAADRQQMLSVIANPAVSHEIEQMNPAAVKYFSANRECIDVPVIPAYPGEERKQM